MIANHTPRLLTENDIRAVVSADPELEVIEESADGFLLYDSQAAKELPARFLARMSGKTVSELIHISPSIPQEYQVNKDVLADYLWSVCDQNAFVTLNEIVVLWDDEFIRDQEQERLFQEYSDEFALEFASGYLGQLWFDRNIVAINLKEIVDTSQEIAQANADIADSCPFFQFTNLVVQGLLTTAIHELRHLQMDTNIFLPEDDYPLVLNTEENVEAYSRQTFESHPIPNNVMKIDETIYPVPEVIYMNNIITTECNDNELFKVGRGHYKLGASDIRFYMNARYELFDGMYHPGWIVETPGEKTYVTANKDAAISIAKERAANKKVSLAEQIHTAASRTASSQTTTDPKSKAPDIDR